MKMLIKEKLSQHKSKTPEGYLICENAILARTGKQRYMKCEVYPENPDDYEEIDIDRLPDDVFSESTMASFENKPVTVEHPDENVNAENYKTYSVGFVRDIRKSNIDGNDVMIGNLIITDAQTIEEIENGEHCDLSCGYDCDITKDDHPRQINIRGNHVALCAQGRAGIAKIVDSLDVKDVNPKKGESKEDFIARFMKETKNEYPDEKQRAAVAYSYWNKTQVKDQDMKLIERYKDDSGEIEHITINENGQFFVFYGEHNYNEGKNGKGPFKNKEEALNSLMKSRPSAVKMQDMKLTDDGFIDEESFGEFADKIKEALLAKSINYHKMTLSPDGSITIEFNERDFDGKNQVNEMFSNKYDIQLCPEDEEFPYLTISDTKKKNLKKDKLKDALTKALKKDVFIEDLPIDYKGFKIYYDEEEKDYFFVLNGLELHMYSIEECKEEIDDITKTKKKRFIKTKDSVESAKEYYNSMLEVLNKKLEKLTKNKKLDKNQEDYDENKEKMIELVKEQIEEYNRKLKYVNDFEFESNKEIK